MATLHNFNEVLSTLNSGGVVRRKSWPKAKILQFTHPENTSNSALLSNFLNEHLKNLIFSTEDRVATDWESIHHFDVRILLNTREHFGVYRQFGLYTTYINETFFLNNNAYDSFYKHIKDYLESLNICGTHDFNCPRYGKEIEIGNNFLIHVRKWWDMIIEEHEPSHCYTFHYKDNYTTGDIPMDNCPYFQVIFTAESGIFDKAE